MNAKRIYILNGHPAAQSLSRTLAENYADAARAAGHDVRMTHLHDLDFDPDYGFGGYVNQKPLEDGLEQVLEDIEWAQHVVLTTPMWWGGLPAKLKGLFDRAFLPGRTYSTRETNWMGFPTPMLGGRTGRVIMTSDTPGWFMRLVYKNALLRQIKDQILGFVGIKPAKVTYFSGASHPNSKAVERWVGTIKKIGAAAA
ncbi:MAG: NAD(P)H-dependent oxidoreductase [Pseudomonadota bacterium]